MTMKATSPAYPKITVPVASIPSPPETGTVVVRKWGL